MRLTAGKGCRMLVHGDASCLDAGRTGQAEGRIRKRQGFGDSAATPAVGNLRTEARADAAHVAWRKTKLGRSSEEAENQDGAHDQSHEWGHSDRETVFSTIDQ